jgi:HK97 family phage major capsid protein
MPDEQQLKQPESDGLAERNGSLLKRGLTPWGMIVSTLRTVLMSRHIQFKQDVGTYKLGDYSEVPDPVAEQFVEMKVAEYAPEDPITRAVVMQQAQTANVLKALFEKQLEEEKAERKKYELATRDFARPKHHFAIGAPDPTSEKDKLRNLPQNCWFRSLVYSICHDIDADTKKNALSFLTTPYEEGGWGCRAMAEGTGSLGGYTTPVLYDTQVWETAAEQEVIIPRAEVKPLGSRQVEYPALNQFLVPQPGQSAFFGGMQVYRKGENVLRQEADVFWKKIIMLAQDLTAYTPISRDLIQDASIPMDAYVVRLMGQAIGWREDWESINGTGEGMFQGFLNSPALLTVTRHTNANKIGQTNSNIDIADILNMKVAMLVGARDPVWLVHPYTVANLAKMTDGTGKLMFVPYSSASDAIAAVGTSGNQSYAGGIGGAAGSISKRLAGVLMGDPVFISEKVPAPAITSATTTTTYGPFGEISYVDCRSYWVGRRSGIEVGLSEHYLFQNDELAIRAKVRNDGKPGQLAPITLADGVSQVSGFVTLSAGA